ncbi:hypothetical protein ETD86_29500 [Nonomuraea turkmeniaca]|uniref:Uncharacterized protein n=1 Tax=Nonomuraea turkmeniaca TaxID=103838 RepID=A0A5S4FAC4_9ACTN|nr:hypothetical protein [Nonomuraea turkmeniaca]TMR14084.1 hypothetical protein ETD86_29500 [Nonomuraea turkmeniaca]
MMTNLLKHARGLVAAAVRPIREAAENRADYIKAIDGLREALTTYAAHEGLAAEVIWWGDYEIVRLGGVDVALARISGIAPPPPIAAKASRTNAPEDGLKISWDAFPPDASDLLPVVAMLRPAA